MCHVIQYVVLYIERALTKHKTKPCVGPNQWVLLQILSFVFTLNEMKVPAKFPVSSIDILLCLYISIIRIRIPEVSVDTEFLLVSSSYII